jgi:hypothetical protein
MSAVQSLDNSSLEQKVVEPSLGLNNSSLEQKVTESSLSLDNSSSEQKVIEPLLGLDEPEVEQTVTFYLAYGEKHPLKDEEGNDIPNKYTVTYKQIMLKDKEGNDIPTEYTLTYKQLHISGLYFSEEKDEKTNEVSFKPTANELEGRLPVDMNAWAGKYDAYQANYALGKCVEWMRHYNGVAIPTWKGKLPHKPKLEDHWKDHTFAEDGKMPWCVKWINDVYEASVGCDKVYQICFCANYFFINSLFHLGACKVAAIMKGRKFADLPALIGVPPKNVPAKSTGENESKTNGKDEADGKAEKNE